jgi:predicted nuclease of predicted toxin-antitoxin system
VNLSLKQPDPFVIFLDRSLGKQIIATSLRGAGCQVEVHDDHFSPDARDEEWLAQVGSKGWVVLTKDKRIKYRALELAAAVSARAKVFTLTAGSVQGGEMAEIFLKAMARIKNYVAENDPPYIVKVSRAGLLSKVYP